MQNTPPESLLRLIETFDEHIDHYKSGKYNETQVRREFIDPFFKALGWDIDNESGYSGAYKDVIHEDAIKVGGNTKAPDYCFRIGGQRKFFLEAKRPSVNLKDDIAPAFQLRRYAWSAKLPLSILTDFEEFAVYDSRIKPKKTDKSNVARILYYNYKEYIDKWDEIYSIFAKESILKGSFDSYAESSKKKRGTDEVDDAFLDEIERWRSVLVKNILLNNAELSIIDINYAVQKTIDRIIFLRICEDRGIEDYGNLKKLLSQTDVYKCLLGLFKTADARYNSGLFHFDDEKGQLSKPDKLTTKLKLDDKVIKDIVKNLYYPDSPYEFSVLPADILGKVYEQFLGKTIYINEKKKLNIEDKPEVRKAGGIYYTPKYVVDYIVENTLGKLLNGYDLNKLKPISVKQAQNIKLLDPACGSGSFLIVAYQYLLDWHRNQYTLNLKDGKLDKGKIKRHSSGKYPKLYQTSGGDYQLTSSERKRILTNNIYGVDIDSQAVEVTKLSLLLKVLEGETKQSLQMDLLSGIERILPDLGNNIKCGNSLIDDDYYNFRLFDDVNIDEQNRINSFNWENVFQDIYKNGGFDCVIGNPPYGATIDDLQKDYFGQAYFCQSYQLDSYLLFMERAIKKLMREGSFLGFIIPNPWLTNIKQQHVRTFITNESRVEKLIHFTKPVFESAVVDTEILILSIPYIEGNLIDIRHSSGPLPVNGLVLDKTLEHQQSHWQESAEKGINIFLSDDEIALYQRLSDVGDNLETLVNLSVGIKPYQKGKGNPKQKESDVKNRVFDSDTKKDSSYRQILRGKDINKYIVNPKSTTYIKYGPWLAEPRPKAGFDADEKIVMRQTGDSLIAALDDQQYLCMNNMHVLSQYDEEIGESFRYLLGILNSTLLDWYYWCLNPEKGEGLAEVKRTNIARLPIYRIDFKNKKDVEKHDNITSLVDKMIGLQNQLILETNPHSQDKIERAIETVNKQINTAIFQLYGITKEEIEIVMRLS